MKRCPYCAEEIQDAAVVCKHCGRDLKQATPAPAAAALLQKKKTSPAAWGCLTVLVLLGVMVLIGVLNAPTPTRTATTPSSAPSAASPPAGSVLALLSSRGGESSSDFICVEGEVQNISGDSLKSVAVVVSWYDKHDSFITSDTTMIEYDPLLPGQKSPFHSLTRRNPEMQRYSVSFKRLLGGELATEDRRAKK